MAHWYQFGLQDATSPIIEEYIFFHDFTNLILLLIISFVTLILGIATFNTFMATGLLEIQIVECIWTLIPALILIQIAVPSLLLLYISDENTEARLTLKTIGHQWYWSYEYSDLWLNTKNIEFDSYMVPNKDSDFRLLEVDNRTPIPFNTHVRVLVSSADVLHSWTIPTIGVKVDACPGRLNHLIIISHRPGVFYGQCSEICGANHRFIPISLNSLKLRDFILWAENK